MSVTVHYGPLWCLLWSVTVSVTVHYGPLRSVMVRYGPLWSITVISRTPIKTQAVAGSNYMFLYIATGFPGSIHDARMLQASSLYRVAEEILADPLKDIQGVNILSLLIGDGA